MQVKDILKGVDIQMWIFESYNVFFSDLTISLTIHEACNSHSLMTAVGTSVFLIHI